MRHEQSQALGGESAGGAGKCLNTTSILLDTSNANAATCRLVGPAGAMTSRHARPTGTSTGGVGRVDRAAGAAPTGGWDGGGQEEEVRQDDSFRLLRPQRSPSPALPRGVRPARRQMDAGAVDVRGAARRWGGSAIGRR